MMLCMIYCHLHNFKNVKTPMEECLKLALLYGCFSRFFKLYKYWYRIAQSVSANCEQFVNMLPITILNTERILSFRSIGSRIYPLLNPNDNKSFQKDLRYKLSNKVCNKMSTVGHLNISFVKNKCEALIEQVKENIRSYFSFVRNKN